MMDYAASQTNSLGVALGKPTTAPPSINENHARAIGNIERCHVFASKIEDALFDDARGPTEANAMPDAAAWRSNLIANESDHLAARLEAILNRL